MNAKEITLNQLWLTVHQLIDELRNGHLQKKYLTVKETAQYLGVSTSKIYKMTSNREISYFRRDGLVYFERSVLDKYITQNKIESDYEVMSNLKNQNNG